MVPLVALIGRPNTGKSTLFNRIVGKRLAIESDIPGTTRDRIFEKVSLNDKDFIFVDTGGLEFGQKMDIEADVQSQTKLAINDADLILIMIDAKSNLSSDDFYAADLIRKKGKKAILVANKCDNSRISDGCSELYQLGFGQPIPISALHAFGLDHLKSEVVNHLKDFDFQEQESKKNLKEIPIAIIGRPNTGKSTLVNALINEDKLIMSDIPGTTRDSISHYLEYNDKILKLIDTAGIRRKGKIREILERFSVMRGLNAINESEIVFWLIDSVEGITSQDKHVIQFALENHKGIVITVNKTDTFEDYQEEKNKFLNILRRELPFLPFAPVIFISALKRKNLTELLNISLQIDEHRKMRIPDDDFSLFLQKIIMQTAIPRKGKKVLKIHSGTQDGINPPTFTFHVNDRTLVHFSYRRYIENQIRQEYGFNGTAIKMLFKNK
ncbi:ribosome biogenesis GTPase Der [Candidatus Peregrinibacteria bacterium RIFOXYA2_FULL_33_7]|nr:MAG: GTP-binding protein GTP-binding protein [Candidatus Peregrinibacteria bacterium GW2011_GWC2_33_13]OGJ50431.1 MAG: ribosome biogenesis GTPase Der [Candidatus Peregrinibacteria bacterium RIFOXYA2_FULL_33_7]